MLNCHHTCAITVLSIRILFNCVDDISAAPFNGLVFQHYRKLTMAPKKSKRSASDDSSSDSGPDDRNPPPKKSKSTDKGSSKPTNSNEEEHSFALDRNRFVKVRDFRGKLFIDIREFYEKNGEMLPGKKGISLNISQWNKLREQIDDIQESVEKMG